MAKREKLQKTNAMRELDRAGLAYTVHTYEVDESDLSGTHVASVLGQDPDCVFKTLVTATPEGGHVVCCIPVAEELDLKRAAAAAGEVSVDVACSRPACNNGLCPRRVLSGGHEEAFPHTHR